MEQKKILFPCIHLAKGEVSPRVIVCGDPKRAEKIGGLLENGRCVAQNREFWSYSGRWNGVDVTVTSHGVGCGGAAIAFESLCRAGAKVIIRVGTCGGMQPSVPAGQVVVATAACREDGVTEKMLPLSYPAVCHREVVAALANAAQKNGLPVQEGIVLTQALFYPGLLESTVKLYAKAGVLAMENEVASLLVVAGLHGVKAGAILAADAPAFELVGVEGYQPDEGVVHAAIEGQIIAALDAVSAVQV